MTVVHPGFGFDEQDVPLLANEKAVLNQVLQTAKPLGMVSAQQLLREAYDVTFGIYNHLMAAQIESNPQMPPDGKRPLALVALHPAEDWAGQNTALESVLRGFAENQVGEIFKISVVEFLDLPVEYAQRLMRISKKVTENKTQVMTNVSNELKQIQEGQRR